MTENQQDTNKPSRNPLTHMPGQSLREHIDDLIDEDTMPWITLSLCMIAITMISWCVVCFKIPGLHWVFTIFTAMIVPMSALKIMWAKRKVSVLRPDRSTQEAVGQFLEEHLRPAGYQVVHNIQAEHFSIDHVLIGPSGLYTLETKTHSKPEKGPCVVTYDGEKIKVNGFHPDRDPIAQALSEARWLQTFLETETGRKFKVQPVVLYPAWYVTAPVDWPEVWVMNHPFLIKKLAKLPARIDDADVHLIAYHLKRYVGGQRKMG